MRRPPTPARRSGRPPPMDAPNPITPAAFEVFACWRARCAALVDVVERCAAEAHTDADPDAIHDVRVATRRLAATLGACRPAFQARPRKRAMRALRRMRRAAGALRDRQVHLKLLDDTASAIPPAARPVLEDVCQRWTQDCRDLKAAAT